MYAAFLYILSLKYLHTGGDEKFIHARTTRTIHAKACWIKSNVKPFIEFQPIGMWDRILCSGLYSMNINQYRNLDYNLWLELIILNSYYVMTEQNIWNKGCSGKIKTKDHHTLERSPIIINSSFNILILSLNSDLLCFLL